MGNIFNPDFRDFLQALNDCSVRYLLVGGYSVILHGRSRTTGDMDVWIEPTEENYRLMLQAFRLFGLPATAILKPQFLDTAQYDVFSFGREPVAIDIMTAVKGLGFGTCFERARWFEDDGLRIRTLAFADLESAKRAAARPKDLDDLEHLSGGT